MLDAEVADALLWRVAVSSLSYHPGKMVEEPGYAIDEDVRWCVATVAGTPIDTASFRIRVAEVIEDPTAHRKAFSDDVLALVLR
ncbi:hypothetical protein [Microbacterium sp.]|uniref:hypothetical protein n=1 Tax=Microbacterium sp. TaxID=51671 RepID=UPI001AC4EC1F|nr:hypothetical protein [Microbacterium sp.]MBN9180120.1 hypothetical protein [Microbacterium sp.]MBN9187291.1 hypothetical protein [Microbacterium sp.]MBN9193736.1 hypothetical protein [Microbacterium sp.]